MAGARILVVDDEPDITVYLSSFLEDHGYTVVCAEDASVAQEILARYTPDLILIDVMMPGRSGLDLMVTLRRDPRLCEVPLLVVTGNDRVLEDACRSYLRAHAGVRGPDAVLGKPVAREKLLSLVEELTRR